MDEIGVNSFRELSIRSGLSDSAIGKRKREGKLPTVEMADGMCRVLHVTWVELWTQAGKVPDTANIVDQNPDIANAVHILGSMESSEKRANAIAAIRGIAGHPPGVSAAAAANASEQTAETTDGSTRQELEQTFYDLDDLSNLDNPIRRMYDDLFDSARTDEEKLRLVRLLAEAVERYQKGGDDTIGDS